MENYNDTVKLYKGDCLEVMKNIEDKSVDMVLCDLPYGTTRCKWDVIIPFDKMWKQYNRITKDNGAIVLFGSEPFSSTLRMSNVKNYRYDLIWNKMRGSDPMNSKHRPMRSHENISIFYKKKGVYNPQMVKLDKPDIRKNNKTSTSDLWNKNGDIVTNKTYTHRFPLSIIKQTNSNQKNKLHPTQKPVALLEYLIKTYTNEGQIILDNTMGSGSTGVACLNTNRKFIGIEMDEKYFEIAKERIENTYNELTST
ncbi:MAG: DNA-methyltransferase [Sarcina sp.]